MAKVQRQQGKNTRQQAFAYLRTSSAANVGADKDSDARQRAAISAFADRADYEVVAELDRKSVV